MEGSIVVLYKVTNYKDDAEDPLFNAFSFRPNGRKTNLATIKQHCVALHGLSHLGPDGYHWRVCVPDKGEEKTFSWWDIQDENASLPVQSMTQYQLMKFLAPPVEDDTSVSAQTTKAARGALKSFGKAMSSAVSGSDGVEGPPLSVMVFKLLDLVKMHDDFGGGGRGSGGKIPQPTPSAAAPAPRPPRAAPTPARASAPPPRRQQEASLMDFGAAPSAAAQNNKTLHHMHSSPANFNNSRAPPSNETRAERLKREYAKKAATSNRVWDDVDQRWVEKQPTKSTASSVASSNGKKSVGISLDASNAVGKSASVAAAVNKRVNDMRESQQKAVNEARERESKKKAAEAEEDEVRKRLEPKIKEWSEEYGKKKQLRALLASLHVILWPGAKWKQISIGDLMQDAKVKKFYHKATLVVHPDKTHHLGPEERFLAKRIFDALTHAKVDFDNGKK